VVRVALKLELTPFEFEVWFNAVCTVWSNPGLPTLSKPSKPGALAASFSFVSGSNATAAAAAAQRDRDRDKLVLLWSRFVPVAKLICCTMYQRLHLATTATNSSAAASK
jgi:hypothetical protein